MRKWDFKQLERRINRVNDSPKIWSVPPLGSASELAAWLSISEKKLNWLASLHSNSTPGSHYQTRWIRKRVGYRLIESPKPLLKQIQRLILSELLDEVPVSKTTHGFCKGRNTKTYVEQHVGRAVCLKMDLRQFFPSITSNRVYGLFNCLGYPTEVARDLTGLCTTIAERSTLLRLRELSTSGQNLFQLHACRHLPQGAPTSPALSNLIAFRLDRRLEGLAKHVQGRYTRYADDLLFSFDSDFKKDRQSKNRLTRMSQKIATIAIEEGFEVNFRKTRIMFESQRQFATGLVINNKPNSKRETFDRLKAILHNCRTHGPESQNRDNHADFRAHLLGRIEWIRYVNPVRGEKLATLFEAIDW